MYEDIYPEKKKGKVTVTDFDNLNDLIDEATEKTKPKNKINLYPKGQTVGRKVSKKARNTMKRAIKVRKYIKEEDEKDKE